MAKLLEVCARSHVIYQALIIIAILQDFYFPCSVANKITVCNNVDCQELADSYKRSINANVKPCNNFYDYVCHGWGANNPRPKDSDVWNIDTKMDATALLNVKKILDDPKVVPNAKDLENAKTLYKACMNLPVLEQSDFNTIKNIMQKIGNWPLVASKVSPASQNVTWWQIENKYMNIAGESSFFEYLLIDNFDTPFQITLFFRRLTSPYGKLKRNYPWLRLQERKSYRTFVKKIISNVAPSASKQLLDSIDPDLDDVINFREQLKFVITNAGKQYKLETKTIAQLQEWYNGILPSQTTEKIDWLAMVRSMYKDSKSADGKIVENSAKVVIQIQYFEQILRILAKTPKHIIVNHIHLYFAERHLILDTGMLTDLENSVYTASQRSGMIRDIPERWKYCIENNNMAEMFGRAYVNKYFLPEKRNHVSNMVKETRRLLRKQISETTWVQPTIKKIWIEKLDSLTAQVGYPDWYIPSNVPIKNSESDVDPLRADVYYSISSNKLCLGAAYLQSPLYSLNFPFAINYGSVMSTIGHEMYHALDYNVLKVMLKPVNKTAAEVKQYEDFENRAQCFKEQYNAYRAKYVRKWGLSPHVRVPETVKEDIPDVMGLKLAYMKYKEELLNRNGSCPILPGLEKFDCEKLFFISFGNLYCANSDPSAESEIVLFDIHSQPEIRVNGAVANMKEFGQAFNCKPDDPLVLEKTCDFWK